MSPICTAELGFTVKQRVHVIHAYTDISHE
jgi:hypothetical protein